LSNKKNPEPWKKLKCAEAIDRKMVTTIVFRRKIPVLSARLPPKLSVELDFWTFMLCLMFVHPKKPGTLKKFDQF
jgi:hypothetical protein